jgi:phage/plasmid-like protein (TIGR03299 family)
MSKETMTWLRENIRIGYVTQDGPAWWAADNHMADGSHFSGPVPIEEVRRILSVPLVEGTMTVNYTGANGESMAAKNTADFKPIVRQDTGQMFKVFKSGYQIHAYEEWMLNKVARVLDTNKSDLTAKSVGLLQGGAQAWLQIRLSEEFEVNGFGYVPFFTAATSANGSLSSQFDLGFDAAVCDNTLSYALLNATTKAKFRHTLNSNGRDDFVRDSLGLLFTAKDEFAAAAEMLMSIPVSEAQWTEFLNQSVPVPAAKEGARGTRGVTIATNRQTEMNDLYFTDPKVKPWNGTAFGAFQADNTWRTWNGVVRGADGGRMERYHSNMIDGTVAEGDTQALKVLGKVLGRDLLKVTA